MLQTSIERVGQGLVMVVKKIITAFSTKNFDYPEKTLKYKHIRRISD